MKRILLFLVLLVNVAIGQNVKVTMGYTTPWPKPGIIYVPAGTNLPLIFFVGGTGQANDVNTLDDYGPSAKIAAGEKINAVVASIAPGLYPPSSYIDAVLEELCNKYPIDRNNIHLTGLSMGGQVINNYVSVPAYGKKIKSVFSLQGVQVPAQPLADNYAGKWWGVEGGSPDEYRGGDLIATALNKKRPVSAELTIIPQGKPGYTHCCWETMYANTFRNKAGQSWLEWALGTSTPDPIVVPPVTPIPVKVIVGRVFVAGWEFVLYTDGSSESKK